MNNIQINSDQFGNFMSAPTFPAPPIPTQAIGQSSTLNDLMKSNEKYVIDNQLLYKKLVDLENEIKQLKNMMSNLQYPPSVYYPTQPFTPRPNTMQQMVNQTPQINYPIMKPNQGQYF